MGFHVPQQDSGIRQEFLLHQGCPFAWLSLLKKRRRRLSLLRKSEEAFNSAKGSYMKDFDGNDCIDYAGSWGPAIIGHHADDERSGPFLQVEHGLTDISTVENRGMIGNGDCHYLLVQKKILILLPESGNDWLKAVGPFHCLFILMEMY
ncbi:hypothetical protein OIU76_000382 [Salix suchowensis]|nr:hypothetical protein OIU76_000382 [Salix suchowensis]